MRSIGSLMCQRKRPKVWPSSLAALRLLIVRWPARLRSVHIPTGPRLLLSPSGSSPRPAPSCTPLRPSFPCSLVLPKTAATSAGGAGNRGRRCPTAARHFITARTSGGGCIGVNEIGTFAATCSVEGGESSSGGSPNVPGPDAPTNVDAGPDMFLDSDVKDGESTILARSSVSVGGR